MPIYEFHCAACDLDFEALVPMAEKDSVRCEQCGGKVERVISCCFGFSEADAAPVGSSGGC